MTEKGLQLTVVESLHGFLQNCGSQSTIFVDIPIGLGSADVPRYLDQVARHYLPASLRSSVFETPCRPAVYAADYTESRQINKDFTGKSVSVQAWNICPRIKEVDTILRNSVSMRTAFYEAHPEICFQQLKGTPLLYKKKTREGHSERMEILSNSIEDINEIIESFLKLHKRSEVQPDDALDACCLLVSAQIWDRRSFIKAKTDVDEEGIPMRMPLLTKLI